MTVGDTLSDQFFRICLVSAFTLGRTIFGRERQRKQLDAYTLEAKIHRDGIRATEPFRS